MAHAWALLRGNGRAAVAAGVASLSARLARLRLPSVSATGIRQLHLMVAMVAPVLMLLTIAFMAQQQNAEARQSEQARALTLQQFILAQAATVGLGNARWNNAYRAAVLKRDLRWMDENWGPDAYGTIDYDDVFLVGSRGATLYASIGGKRVERSARSLLGNHLRLLLAQARRPGLDQRATTFAPYDGDVGIANLTRVRPVDPDLLEAGADERYLLTVKRLNPRALASLELPSGFERLAISRRPLGDTTVPLRDLRGDAFAWLGWEAHTPGDRSALAVMPVALLLFALLAYAGLVGARTAKRWADEVLSNEAAARWLAERDSLTELPNRRSFVDRLHDDLSAGRPVAIVYVDLDGFKAINDAFGHLTGDMLLIRAAERIAEAASQVPGTRLARLGGDEFALALTGRDAELRGQRLAHAILDAFSHPVVHDGRQVYLGASLGIAGPEPDLAAVELIRHADVAMYAAKAAGRRQWRSYEPAMDAGRDTRQQLAVELRLALQQQEIDVFFQPIVDAQSERIVAAEALARWTSATRGPVDPSLFISVAEEAGLISELTRQVLRKSALAAVDWSICVAVNLSAADAWDAQFADSLLAILAETGMPADRLELEITEGYLLREADAAREILTSLRVLGVEVALDDFGTGFASLTYLRKLPLDRVKLTREFLAEIVGESGSQPLASAIVQLGNALGLPVTAEGVETREQADVLRAAGCTRLQGWLYGRPMSAANLTQLLGPLAASAEAGST